MLWKWGCLCNDSLFNGSFAKNWLCCAVSKRVRHKGSGRHSNHNLKSHYQIFVEVDWVFQRPVFHCCQKTLFCTYQKWQSDENWCLLAQHLLLLSTSEIIGFVTQLQWVHCVGGFRSWCLFPSGDTVFCDNRYLCHTPWFGCVRGVLHPDLGVQAQQTCSARVAEFLSCRLRGSCQMAANHP